MRSLIEALEKFTEARGGWKEVDGGWLKSGDGVRFVVKEQAGPGMPIYVLYMEYNGSVFRLKGQKRKPGDLFKIADSWMKSFAEPHTSIDLTRDWVPSREKVI